MDETAASTQTAARPHAAVSFATGLVFLLGAACVAWFVFPTLVRFRCDRAADSCSLEQSNLLRRRTTLLRASSVTGARVETVGGDGTTYRVWVDTRDGSHAFTGYSIGTSPDEKSRIVAAVTAFVRDGAATCEATQDERLVFSLLSAGLAGLGLVALAFGAGSAFRGPQGGLRSAARRRSLVSEPANAATYRSGRRLMASASHSPSTEPAGRVSVFLGRRWLPAATIALALVLVSPALSVGPMGDDYMQMARVDPRLHVPGFAYAPLDLFAFVSGDPAQRAVLREEGVFGWWMAPDFKLSFWRPLSSFTHVVDHWLWPRSSPLAHAQTLAWFAGLLVVIAALYRGLHAPWVAHLALALYALDDARGWVLGWTANRNVIVAAVFAFAALLAHDRARRRGWRPGVWLAPALYAMALLGGEAALAVTGYLLAHALFLDQGPLGRRLLRLWPYAALSLAWLAVYRALGYGTIGGDAYVNPLDTPLLFVRVLAERLPILAAAQLGAGLSDAWTVLPWTAQLAGYALALLVLALFAALIAPLWRRSPVCRFWTTGAVLSLPPVCATFPMDRLLVFAGVGAMGTVALFLSEWLRPALSLTRARRVATATAAVLLIGFHLVLAPLLLPARVLLMGVLVSMGERLESSIPRDESIRERSLVILGSAAEMTTLPPWMQRQVQGVPRPRRFRLLANSYGALRVTRVDERTLRIRPQRGFLDNELLRIVRGVSRPFHPGDEVVLSDMRVRVREALPDGRAAEADFRFGVPLEDASLLWMRLQAGGPLRPWAPPAVGETVTLASVEPHSATATSAASR